MYRIGIGYDVHKLKDGLDFFIGGIQIPYNRGCVAHSDGDVLIHAMCDALLGAANLRDIGYHFPDNDNQYKNIDSKILLKRTYQLVQDRGFVLGNIDSVVSLQKPKLKDFIPEMQKTLANVLGVDESQVSIKATTTEGLGFEGREEGVSAQAVALIYSAAD